MRFGSSQFLKFLWETSKDHEQETIQVRRVHERIDICKIGETGVFDVRDRIDESF